MPPIVPFELAVAAVVLGLVTIRSRRKRSIEAVATARGLWYADADPFGCVRGPLEFLHQGSGQQVTSVLWRGEADVRRVKVFELRWYNDSWAGTRDPATRGDAEPGHSATCATALVNAAFPRLRVGPTDLGSSLRDAIRNDKIEVESDEFNEAFDVTSDDRRFAVAFLDPTMQALLLESMQGLDLEVHGAWVLVHSKPLPPKALPGLFGLIDRILDAIPPTVRELYPGPLGPDPATPMPDPYVGALSPLIADVIDDERAADELPPPPPARPERDIDGNVVTPHRQDPWGPGRPLPHERTDHDHPANPPT